MIILDFNSREEQEMFKTDNITRGEVENAETNKTT